jgi:hypothetical protein
MALAPERAELGVTVGGTTALGLRDARITIKRTMKDVTCDDDCSVRRFGTIKDGDLSLTFVYDPADTGQQAILTSYTNGTQVQYVVTKGSVIYTATAGVESISFTGGPADEQAMEVTLAVTGGIAVS